MRMGYLWAIPKDLAEVTHWLRYEASHLGQALRCLLPCFLLVACASLPPRPALAPTKAVGDYATTALAAVTDPALPTDGRSGFRLLPFGPNSFATRIELSRLATRSLDVQYYVLQGDNTGLALMHSLRDAGLRGVRVRVLVDDL
jgi:cardiolipin synthase C